VFGILIPNHFNMLIVFQIFVFKEPKFNLVTTLLITLITVQVIVNNFLEVNYTYIHIAGLSSLRRL
jgi:hypothetical protein